VLFDLEKSRFVGKSGSAVDVLMEGSFINAFEVESLPFRVDTVKLWYATTKAVNFAQRGIGVGFRLKCYFVVDLVC
jgi:hypothetical protein